MIHGHASVRTARCKVKLAREQKNMSSAELHVHNAGPVGPLAIRLAAVCAALAIASTDVLGQSIPLSDADVAHLLREMLRDGVLTLDERANLIGAGVEPQIVQQHVVRLRARRLGAPRELGPSLVLPIRSPMTSGELEKILQVLRPSQEQRNYILEAYASYHDRESERWMTSTADLWEFAASTAAQGMKEDDLDAMIGRAYRDARRLDELAQAADRVFFLQVAQILSDEQMLGLQRAQWLRQRTSIPPQPAIHAGADVDLSLLMDTVLSAHVDDRTAHDEALNELMVAYETRLTRLWTDLQRAGFDAEVERIDNLIKSRRAGPNVGLRMHLLDERKRIVAEPLRISRSIFDLNTSTMSRLSVLVPPVIYNTLRNEYLSRTYPAAYPIDDRVANAIDGIWKKHAADELVSAVLPSVLTELRSELEATAGRMAELSMMWKIRVAESSGFMPDEYGTYRDQMHALLRRQHAAQTRAIEMVGAVWPHLTPELDARRNSVDRDYLARLSSPQGSHTTWPEPFGNDRAISTH